MEAQQEHEALLQTEAFPKEESRFLTILYFFFYLAKVISHNIYNLKQHLSQISPSTITRNLTSFFSSLCSIMETQEEHVALFQTEANPNEPPKEEETKEEYLGQPPPNLDEVEAILGYKFKNKCLLKDAFTHSSYDKCSSYERLEYIGDSVLNLMVTKEQYLSYPKLGPGWLTRLRATNVDKEKLARVAVKHKFYRYMRHNKPIFEEQIQSFTKDISEYPLHSSGLVDVPKDLADIVESTVGAVFIDCGFSIDTVWKIFKRLLEPLIDPDTIQTHPKTELYEVCQKKNLKIQPVDVWKESKTYYFVIDGKLLGKGIHDTKKEIALNRAAKSALDNIKIVLGSVRQDNVERVEVVKEQEQVMDFEVAKEEEQHVMSLLDHASDVKVMDCATVGKLKRTREKKTKDGIILSVKEYGKKLLGRKKKKGCQNWKYNFKLQFQFCCKVSESSACAPKDKLLSKV